jgi:hypothetical protein
MTTSISTYWQKQILPEGHFTNLDLRPEKLTRTVLTFDPGEGIPFTLSSVKDATKANGGTLIGLEYWPNEGILGHFTLSDEAAAHVEKYPRFGTTATVSPDGRIHAVRGTNTPQFTGMAGWEKVTTEAPPPPPPPQQVHNLSEEQLNTEGDIKMSALDPNVQLRLEQFIEQHCGVSMTGQSQEKVIELAMELAPGREREYAEALTGKEIIPKGLPTNDEISSWLDAYGVR